MIWRMLNRLATRTFGFLVIVVSLAGWLWFGNAALERVGKNSPEEYVKKTIADLSKIDPEAGADLTKIARERDIRAVAASIRMREWETKDGLLRALARDLQGKAEGLRWYALCEAAINDFQRDSVGERDGFLETHGAVYRHLLKVDDTGEGAEAYAELLTNAPRSGDGWIAMRNDPTALAVSQFLAEDPAAWKYYIEEREWLNDIIASLPVVEKEGGDGSGEMEAPPVLKMVQTARRYDPVFKKTYLAKLGDGEGLDPAIGSVLAELFDEYGDFLVACDDNGIPAAEMADIVYVNPMSFAFSGEQAARAREIHLEVARMKSIRTNKPNVWTRASEEMNALWLEREAPEQADSILGTYPGGDLPTFLFTYYESVAATAAQAIVTYGELGIYVLNKYKEHREFLDHLADKKAGIRLVPFITSYPENGFSMLRDKDYRWIDKYFNPDGSERDQGWIKDIPLVGAPFNVVENWVKGYPNTWGEIGWAAFDIADCTLLIATLGASGTTIAGRQAAKQVIKARAGRTLLGEMGKRFVRMVGSYKPLSLLVRVVKAGYNTVRLAETTVINAGRYIWASGKAAYAAWRGVPPVVRRIITGTAAALMFGYSFRQRDTPDAFRRALGDVGKMVGQTIRAVGSGVAEGLVEATNEALGGMMGGLDKPERGIVWLAGAVVLASLLFLFRPSRRDIRAWKKGI